MNCDYGKISIMEKEQILMLFQRKGIRNSAIKSRIIEILSIEPHPLSVSELHRKISADSSVDLASIYRNLHVFKEKESSKKRYVYLWRVILSLLREISLFIHIFGVKSVRKSFVFRLFHLRRHCGSLRFMKKGEYGESRLILKESARHVV